MQPTPRFVLGKPPFLLGVRGSLYVCAMRCSTETCSTHAFSKHVSH